jgi:hypothetical protein
MVRREWRLSFGKKGAAEGQNRLGLRTSHPLDLNAHAGYGSQ